MAPQAEAAKTNSRYSGNYGFGSATGPSSVSQQERQWYMDNNLGDPYAVEKPTTPFSPFLIGLPGGKDYTSGNYRGVDPTARYLYQQSSAPSKTVYLQERAPSTAASSLGVPANTRFAGKSLTINPVAA
jgi:hypothetical protein